MLVVDVRDAPRVEQSGKMTRASRGMLEFCQRQDTDLYCASGGRAALSGRVLKDMGYVRVYNLGAFKEWDESGGSIDKPLKNRSHLRRWLLRDLMARKGDGCHSPLYLPNRATPLFA